MPKGTFDVEGFYEAVDAQRISKKLTWKQVANESGVNASTLTRMAQGKRPDVDGLAALLSWSGLVAEDFIIQEGRDEKAKPEPIAMISTYLRSDPHLTPESAKALDQLVKSTYARLRKD